MSGLVAEPLSDEEPGRQRECPASISRFELARRLLGRLVVVEIEERLDEARSRPRRLGGIGIGGEHRPVRAHGVERLARGAAPPAQAQEAARDRDPGGRGREGLEARDRTLVIAEPPERLPQPEVRLAHDAAGGVRPREPADVQEPRPRVAGVGVALEPVEGHRPAVMGMGRHGRRRTDLEQAVEVPEGAPRVAELERDPAQIVGGVEPELPARIVLDHEQQDALDLGRPSEAQQRLAEPVARFPEEPPIAGLPDGSLECFPRLLQLFALIARPAAFE